MINVLVCDDDKEIVEAIEIYLRQEGYNVLKAYGIIVHQPLWQQMYFLTNSIVGLLSIIFAPLLSFRKA